MNCIFDYDGTVYDTVRVFGPAFRTAYEEFTARGWLPAREWTDERIGSWFGYLSGKMWEDVAPDLSQEKKDEFIRIMKAEVLKFLTGGRAKFYPGMEEVLGQLKKEGHRLFILSNCEVSHMERQRKYLPLNPYFTDYFCTGAFEWKPKYEIFAFIKEKYEGEFVIIGDRIQDMEVGTRCGIKSIGCRYGFGSEEELKDADVVVDSPEEILEVIRGMGEC